MVAPFDAVPYAQFHCRALKLIILSVCDRLQESLDLPMHLTRMSRLTLGTRAGYSKIAYHEMEALDDECQPVELGRCSGEPLDSVNMVARDAEVTGQCYGLFGWLSYISLSTFRGFS